MARIRLVLASMFVGSVMMASPAYAFIVFDPDNFVETSLSAVYDEISTINEEIGNAFAQTEVLQQLQQLANEATMISHEIQNLANLPAELMSPIATVMSNINRIQQAAQNVVTSFEGIGTAFNQLTASLSGKNLNQVYQDALAGRSAVMTRYQANAQAAATYSDDVSTDLDSLYLAWDSARSTTGNVEALQALAEIQALNTQQIARLEQIELMRLQSDAYERANQMRSSDRAAAIRAYVSSDLP